MSAHSLIGASTIKRLIACPGSLRLALAIAADAKPGRAGRSVYAARGTAAHALGEEALRNGYDPIAEIGATVNVDGHDITVDETMVRALRVYVAEVKARTGEGAWWALETRVTLDPYWRDGTRPPVPAFGTADCISYHENAMHLDVIDYKNGSGVFVDAFENPQLFYYAAGALLFAPGPVATVDLTIVQPNVRGKDHVRTYQTTAVDVLMWVEDTLKPAIALATTPDAPLSAGKHCQFCPAERDCPALVRKSLDQARRDFA